MPFGLLPRRERAPRTGGGEVDVLVADERRAIDRRAMILAAERARVEQPQAALLARLHQVLLALEVEDGPGHIHVEVALAQPEGVRRRIPVLQLERFGLRVLLHADDRLPVDLALRIVVAVAGPRVDRAVLANRRTGARPQTAAARQVLTDLLRGEVVAVERVGIAAAALSRRRIDDALPQVQPIGLAVGRQKRLRRRRVGARRHVERPQPSVPRHRVDDVAAGRFRWCDDRRRGQSTRAQHTAAAAARLLDEGAVELPRPQPLTGRHVDAVDVVRHAGHDRNLLRPLRRRHVGDDEGREEVVHLAGLVVELKLPQELHVLHALGRDAGLVLLPRRALVVAAVGQPVRLPRALRRRALSHRRRDPHRRPTHQHDRPCRQASQPSSHSPSSLKTSGRHRIRRHCSHAAHRRPTNGSGWSRFCNAIQRGLKRRGWI